MSELLKGLNQAQINAVTSTEGYIRVIAGAGSGKTNVLTKRFAYLVSEIGILPGNILCVTFTNKAANEMRRRIHSLTGDSDTGYISTFHSFCVSILQEDSHVLHYPKNFLVLDNADIDAMLGIIYEERGLTLRDMTYSNARDMIELRKIFREPEYYLDMLKMSPESLHAKYMQATTAQDIIFYGYLHQEKKCFALDYNDLIKFSLYIFSENEAIKLKWQKRLEYIMIDEFQDIDKLQYRLMEVLCGYHGNLFVVGDPDQTIYSWRGASIKYLMDFSAQFPDVKTIMMMENYRSTPQILAAANSLIDKNSARIKKELLPILPDGPLPVCHHAKTTEDEAMWIAERIRELHSSGVPYRSIAVLYRAHYVTRPLEEVFLKEKLPYTLYSGVQFFNRMEIKDVLSYLRMLVYKDDLSFLRIANVPKRNIGKSRMKFLKEYAAGQGCTLYAALCETIDNPVFRGTKAADFIDLISRLSACCAQKPVSEVLAAVLDASGYEKMLRTEGSQERLDNLAELRQSVYEFETTCGEESTLEHYLNHAALFTGGDTGSQSDKVRLMTVHTAKGLEFPYVFLCALNENIFPSKKIRTMPAMEEERRLAFVALTRAQRGLYLSEAEGRNFDGSPRYPSRFLFDIAPYLLDFSQKPDSALLTEAQKYIAYRSCALSDETQQRFAPGNRVVHPVLGAGTVIKVNNDISAYLIKFDAIETERSISFRARLAAE